MFAMKYLCLIPVIIMEDKKAWNHHLCTVLVLIVVIALKFYTFETVNAYFLA